MTASAEGAQPPSQMPAAEFFGFRFGARGEREAAVEMAVRREHLQGAGVVHGGVIAALADAAAVYLLIGSEPPRESMTSVEFKLNFLRPALPDRGRLAASARLVQRGRTIAVCDVEIAQGEAPVARGLFTYIFTRA